MISSVIVKLTSNRCDVEQTIKEIAAHPGIEAGNLIDSRLLPITIDAASKEEMEQTTRWLENLENTDFVDVVFIHFEDS